MEPGLSDHEPRGRSTISVSGEECGRGDHGAERKMLWMAIMDQHENKNRNMVWFDWLVFLVPSILLSLGLESAFTSYGCPRAPHRDFRLLPIGLIPYFSIQP
jgi:hypothetical protein